MKLLDICEPIFAEVCRMNRALRHPDLHASLDEARVRAAFKAKLVEASNKASGVMGMAEQFRQVTPDILALMDDVVRTSKAPFALVWTPLSQEMLQDAGWAQNFYTRLEETMREPPNELNTERLLIAYHCLGLGFVGMYRETPEVAKEKMSGLQAVRLRGQVDIDHSRPMQPEHLLPKCIDKRDWRKPPRDYVIPAAIALGVMAATLFVGTIVAYFQGVKDLRAPLEKIDKAYADAVKVEAPSKK